MFPLKVKRKLPQQKKPSSNLDDADIPPLDSDNDFDIFANDYNNNAGVDFKGLFQNNLTHFTI